MKRISLLVATAMLCMTARAQQDSTIVNVQIEKNDTMRIGNILIIKKGNRTKGNNSTTVSKAPLRTKKTNSKISTNFFVVDLGFANYTDKTDYGNTGNFLVNNPTSPAISKSDFNLKTAKSINVNIWFFMQRLTLVKRNVHLKYGLGLELNNYRFKKNTSLSFSEGGIIPYSAGMQTSDPFIFRDSISFSKNKLAADYLTVPLLINFSSNRASEKKGISVGFGVSAGYLYSQRNKQISEARGKDKNKGEYDMEKFKLSYIGEVGLGPVKLYGSYSPKSMFQHDLNFKPYNIGIRLSNW